MKQLTLAAIKKEVHHLDENLQEHESYFKTAVIMLAALRVGHDVDKLAAFTKFPKEFIEERKNNLTKSGIWKNGKTHGDWFNEKLGGISFWMDVAVAEGMLKRG